MRLKAREHKNRGRSVGDGGDGMLTPCRPVKKRSRLEKASGYPSDIQNVCRGRTFFYWYLLITLGTLHSRLLLHAGSARGDRRRHAATVEKASTLTNVRSHDTKTSSCTYATNNSSRMNQPTRDEEHHDINSSVSTTV